MKIQLIILLTLLSTIIFGQQLKFKGELVDTIFIKSHWSVYQFDDKGTTKGKANVFSIVFDFKLNDYVINQYYQDEYVRTIRPDTIKIKTKDLNKGLKKNVAETKLEKLLNSLNKNVEPKDLINQIDTVAFKEFVTAKQIKRIAKTHKIDWEFKRKYSTKEENLAFFKSCKSVDTLKLYFTERFDDVGYVVITDVSNTYNIIISTTNSEYQFEGKYPNPVKQPWYDHSDTSQNLPSIILNLNINKSLKKILPENFWQINTISDEMLFNDYITWYFKRRHMILPF